MNDSFIFYRSFFEALQVQDDEVRLALYDAITTYAITGEIKDLSGTAKSMFILIKPQIDANQKRRNTGKNNGSKGAEYGKLGGRPIKSLDKKTPMGVLGKTPMGVKEKPPNVNVNVNANANGNVNANDNVNENVNANGNNTPPTPSKEGSAKKGIYFPNDPNLQDAFTGYIDYRKKIHKPMTDRAIQLAKIKLNNLSNGDSEAAVEILNQSVVNGWQGLFPIKNDSKGSSDYINSIKNRMNVVDDWLEKTKGQE